MTSSTVTQRLDSTFTYDIARRQSEHLTAPAIELDPASCFTVDSLVIYDVATGLLVTGGYITANGLSTIDIDTSERSLVGSHNLYVKTAVSSGEELEQMNLALDITDSCDTSSLVGSIIIAAVEINKGESLNVVQTNSVLTDYISN